MSSLEDLLQDHEVIEKVLKTLEVKLKEAKLSGRIPLEFLKDLIHFSKLFIDKCHHGKEEICLFPCLEKRGIKGPIEVMLAEHEEGRRLINLLSDRIAKYEKGEIEGEEVLKPCYDYLELLSNHIYKENNILFPMGEGVMEKEDHEENLKCFKRREEEIGEHKRLEELAHKMRTS